MAKYTIDRFEGDLAILLLREDETVQVDVHRKQLPSDITQGDIISVDFHEDRTVKYAAILKDETSAVRKKADDLLQKILNKNK